MAVNRAEHITPPPPIPDDDGERIEELRSLRVLDTAAEDRFDRYTRLIADLYEFPVVLVSLVDKNRQWFKSNHGLDFRETGRDISFCAHAITQHGIFIVPDAREDSRFAANPLVTGPPHIRFYAGCTVHGPSGQPLGTLCVIDHKPREFSDRECRQLRQFAELVERELHHSADLDRLRASIEFSAWYDPVTRLPNKRLLYDRLETILKAGAGEHRALAVIVFNVGGLRYFNQAFGTSTGDQLLREVGSRMDAADPVGAFAARLGGDEFVLVLPGAGAGACDAAIETLRGALEKPYSAAGREHFISFRIGVSIFPVHGRSPRDLLVKAASAIRARTDEVVSPARHYSSAHALEVSERLHMETRIRRGLEEHNFRFEYQPIVSLQSGRMVAVEALMRWDDEEIDGTGPDRFIPVAEQSGLIIPLGYWAMRETAGQIGRWRAARPDWHVAVTLNIAAAQLQQPEFADRLIEAIQGAGIPAELLQVEITEFSLVMDLNRVQANLVSLHQSGVRTIIDDFGTGYCSMGYLRSMPVSTLKIDRCFVGGIPEDRHNVAITRTILAMTRTLELTSVAEGVERGEQLEMLRAEGCDCVQGFLLARPMAPERIPELVDKAFV